MNLEGITEKVNKNIVLKVKQGKSVRKKLRTWRADVISNKTLKWVPEKEWRTWERSNMKKFEEIMVLIEGRHKSSDLKGTVQNTINQTDILLCIFSEMSSFKNK